jgi:hypothetical protein
LPAHWVHPRIARKESEIQPVQPHIRTIINTNAYRSSHKLSSERIWSIKLRQSSPCSDLRLGRTRAETVLQYLDCTFTEQSYPDDMTNLASIMQTWSIISH